MTTYAITFSKEIKLNRSRAIFSLTPLIYRLNMGGVLEFGCRRLLFPLLGATVVVGCFAFVRCVCFGVGFVWVGLGFCCFADYPPPPI
jgi:hypothetical protein